MANNYSAWQNRVLPSVKQNPVRAAVEDLIYQDKDFSYGYQGGAKQYDQQSDYWLKPSNVASYYNQIQNNQYADWMDDSFVNFIEQAYGLYEIANDGANWEQWKPLQLDDPARQFLGSFGAPPEELPAVSEPGVYPTVQPTNATTGGLTQAEWDALPWTQRALYGIFSSPKSAGAAIGGIAGVPGGPAGIAAGAGLGAGLGSLADKFPWLSGAFDKLDILAEGVERFVGTASLLTGGDVKTFEDLDAAWKAGHLAYDVARVTDKQMIDLLKEQETVTWTEEELLYDAYTRIRSGEDVDKVYEDIQAQVGFSGQMRDLMGHIVFDPLNLAGIGIAKGVGALAKLGVSAGFLSDAYKALGQAADVAKGPVDLAKRYGGALTSSVPTKEIANMDVVSRWLGQVSKTGENLALKPYVAPTGVKGAANYLGGAIAGGSLPAVIGGGLFGLPGALIMGGLGSLYGGKKGLLYLTNLTPAARALEVNDSVMKNMSSLMHHAAKTDGKYDFDLMVKLTKGMAETPHELANQLSMRSLEAPDAAAVPMALKSIGSKLDTHLNIWKTNETSRVMLDNISRALFGNLDDAKRMDEMLDALRDTGRKSSKDKVGAKPDVTKLDVLFNRIDDAIRKSGNDELIKSLDDGTLNQDSLSKAFDSFIKDGNAASEDAWLAQYYGMVMEDTANWASKWFNVQPDPAIIRMSTMLKNAQSWALLGLNPNYLVNNFVNNMVTMATDGALGFRSQGAIDTFWKRVGVEPPRLRQGVGAIDTVQEANRIISDATKVGDTIDKVSDVASKGSKKIGIFGRWSQSMEGWSSAQAFTSGFKQAWSKLWKPGSGFDRLPMSLQDALGPQMTDYIHSAIRNGMNKAEIEDALWSGYARKHFDDLVPIAAERAGIKPEMARDIFHKLGIDDFLNDNLKGDISNDDVVKVVGDAMKKADDWFESQAAEYKQYHAEKLRAKLGVSGSVEFVDYFANNSIDMEMTEIARWRANERLWDFLDDNPNIDKKLYNEIMRKHYEAERLRYNRFEQRTIADLDAIRQSVDLTDDIGKGLFDTQQTWFDNWKEFYKEIRKMQEEVFKDGYSELYFAEYERLANELYRKHVDIEHNIELQMSDYVQQAMRRQYGDPVGDATIAWRTKLVEMRDVMRNDMAALRLETTGKTHGERSALWKQFVPEHERRIKDYHRSNFDDVNGVYDAARNSESVNTPNNGMSAPMGMLDKFDTLPDVYATMENNWFEHGLPLLQELQRELLGANGKHATTLKGANLDAAKLKELQGYLGRVYGQMSDTKNMAIKHAEQLRDFSLLNYQKRYGFDTFLTAIMPYQFWYTRSMANWAMRSIDKPGYLATWGRLHAAQKKNDRREGYPSRLAGKIKIEMPWLPDFMGDSVYIDPMRQLFPIQLLSEPFMQMAEDSNALDTRARYILEQWAADETVDREVLQQAIDTKEGETWEKALAQAKVEIGSEFNNPMDFMTAISGMLMPLDWAYKLISNKKEKIGELPVTRAIQALTSWATPGGVNLEAPLRKALGLQVGGEYWDYYVDRELSWLAALGKYSYEEVSKAMIDRTGTAYMDALDLVGKRQSVRYFTSSFATDFFPEGEQEIRQLHEEFRAALEANTVAEFFDKHPEYSSRAMAFADTPEDKLRKFAVSAIWDMSQQLPKLTKDRLYAAFGEEFQTSFLDKETRSIDTIETETLLAWSKAMGAELPELAKEYNITPIQVDTGTPAENQILDWYYQQREQLFGNITATQNRYYALPKENRKAFLNLHPELRTYWDWNKGVKQQYPRLEELTKEKYQRDNLAAFEIDPNDFNSALTNRMLGYFYSGQPLEGGARSELNRLWIKYGKPTETLEQFIELLRSYFGQ